MGDSIPVAQYTRYDACPDLAYGSLGDQQTLCEYREQYGWYAEFEFGLLGAGEGWEDC